MAPIDTPASGADEPLHEETTILDLTVLGMLPTALSGRFLHIGPNEICDLSTPHRPAQIDGMVHAVHLHAGRAVSYRNRWVTTVATAWKLGTDPAPGPPPRGPDNASTGIVSFAGTILAFGHDSLAYELTPELGTRRRVDLAGRRSGIAAHPVLDPRTGELHVLANTSPSTQAHITVSPGALARRTRSIEDPPSRIRDLAVTRDHVVLAADGAIGVAPRTGAAPVWHDTGIDAPRIVSAHDDGGTVVAHVLTPALERWTLRPEATTVERDELDPMPQAFARTDERLLGAPQRHLWTVAGNSLRRRDLVTGRHQERLFETGCQPGEFVFVPDPARAIGEEGGWIVGLVHDKAHQQADLLVLDAADIVRPRLAIVRIPRPVPYGRHSLWTGSRPAEPAGPDRARRRPAH